jgi:cytochrome P450
MFGSIVIRQPLYPARDLINVELTLFAPEASMQTDDPINSRKMSGDHLPPAISAPPLYPPSITPPEKPLSLLKFLRVFPKNPLRALPRSLYEDDVLALRPLVPPITYCWITGPELIEDVLIKQAGRLNKSRVEKRVFAKSVGDSVLTADMEHWKWQRRVLAPLFRHQQILDYVPQMSEAAARQVAVWQKAGAGLRNIEADMTEATLAVIMSTMLGSRDMALGQRIMAATDLYLAKSSWEATCAILKLPEWFPHPGTRQMNASSRELRTIMADLIAKRRSSVATRPI